MLEAELLQVHALSGRRRCPWPKRLCRIHGYFATVGFVFCSQPTLIYVVGMFGNGTKFALKVTCRDTELHLI